ncbi:MAG: CidA/LrgA family protein [Gammaproteobacteria bacterium]|nr:CidA/LrgA family protein [Gammaproteobacteria bacterium]
MLLRGLTWLILFQLLGSGLNILLLPFLPGPIIGMVLLLGFLLLRGEVPAPVEQAAGSLLTYLPLILVPPAVGVMAYGAEMRTFGLGILLTLVISFALALPLCGWLLQRLLAHRSAAEHNND